jgi:serine/threonine-protein kinase
MVVSHPPNQFIGLTVANRYRVLDHVASGGMGRVYRAEQIGLGREVALKFMRIGARDDDELAVAVRRFRKEATILARLQHPNVVTVFDYGRFEATDGTARWFIAMELLRGQTLHDRLAAEGRLAIEDALRIARQIARGLREAHTLGLVHRDLKPLNVMLVRTADGVEQVKLLDFGVVKVIGAHDDGEMTMEGALVGSPNYLAPEQITCSPVDERTDVYALGLLMYKMISGVNPFARDPAGVMLAHLQEVPALLDVVVPDCPPDVADLVARCLAKSPAERPASMREVLDELPENPGSITLRTGSRPSAMTRITSADAETLAGAQLILARPPAKKQKRMNALLVASAAIALLLLLSLRPRRDAHASFASQLPRATTAVSLPPVPAPPPAAHANTALPPAASSPAPRVVAQKPPTAVSASSEAPLPMPIRLER